MVELASHGRRPVAVIALAVAVLLVAAFAGSAGAASAAYRRSFDGAGTLEQRLSDARAARCLAPWSAPYRTREYVMARWLGGRNLLEAGDYSGAVESLRLAYRNDVGDQPLLALFRRAQEIEALATNRKAHLQHGHEGPGSTLRPQDVER
jgi:hypothetical protein